MKGKKRIVLDSVFWVCFLLALFGGLTNQRGLAILGLALQALSLASIFITVRPAIKLRKEKTTAEKKVAPPKETKESFFSRIFKKKPKELKEDKLPEYKPEKEKQKEGLPVIAHKNKVDLSKIVMFLILIILMLYLIVKQLISISGQSFWYYFLTFINVIALLILFYSSKYIFRKRKTEIEQEAEKIALEREHEEAVKSGKSLPRSKKLRLLRYYVKKAIEKKFTKEQIIESAKNAGWPEDMIEDAYLEESSGRDVVESLIRKYELNILKKYMKKAIDEKYSEGSIIQSALSSGWPEEDVRECYNSIFGREYTLQKEKEMSEDGTVVSQPDNKYLRVTAKLIRHETDLDRLYDAVKTRGGVKLGEVSSTFKVSKKQAEDWANILEKYGLIELYYPVIGEPELRWKKSKATT